MKCTVCGKNADISLGICFNCAEAESIIGEGKDIVNEGDAKTPMDKLKMLIQKGWQIP